MSKNELPNADHFLASVDHVNELVTSKGAAIGVAKGLLYSIVETLGVIVGDPDLPSHVRTGYQEALELARELQAKIHLH